MKKVFSILLMLVMLNLCAFNVLADETPEELLQIKESITQRKNTTSNDKKTEQIFVKAINDNECENIIQETLVGFHYEIEKQYSISGAYLVRFDSVEEADRAVDMLNARDDIKFAEPNYRIDPVVLPKQGTMPSTIPSTIQFYVNSPVFIVDGVEKQIAVDDINIVPFIDNQTNRTFIPLRTICETNHYEIEWIDNEQKIVMQKGEATIEMTIGATNILVENGEERQYIESDAAPIIFNNRTFVPLRVVSELMGYDVVWHDELKEIVLHKKEMLN